VLDGSHDDSYLMESTQTFYWGSLYCAVRGANWETLGFEAARSQAPVCGISSVPELRAAVERLMATPDAKPEKVFLLWNVADCLYRQQTPAADQWSLEQLMEGVPRVRSEIEPDNRTVIRKLKERGSCVEFRF
jgi:hypothetical protein